jgi:cytochrome c biogenesis protein CcdA
MMRKLLAITAFVLGFAAAAVPAQAWTPFVGSIIALSYNAHSETPGSECMYAYVADDTTGVAVLYAIAPADHLVTQNVFNQLRVILGEAWAAGNSLGLFPTGNMACGYPELGPQVSYDGTNQ